MQSNLTVTGVRRAAVGLVVAGIGALLAGLALTIPFVLTYWDNFVPAGGTYGALTSAIAGIGGMIVGAGFIIAGWALLPYTASGHVQA